MVLTQMSSLALNSLATIMHYGINNALWQQDIWRVTTDQSTDQRRHNNQIEIHTTTKNSRNISRVIYLSTHHNKGKIRALPCKSAELIKLLLGHNINTVALFKSSMHDQYFGDPGQL